jgi:hypothetical protein
VFMDIGVILPLVISLLAVVALSAGVYICLRRSKSWQIMRIFFFIQCHHMSALHFVVSPPGCGWTVTDFWGWDAHEALLHCPDEVDGHIWIWSTRRGLRLFCSQTVNVNH